MKLTKFELEKMSVVEMTAIKAGSGDTCGSDSTHTTCTGTDHDTCGCDTD